MTGYNFRASVAIALCLGVVSAAAKTVTLTEAGPADVGTGRAGDALTGGYASGRSVVQGAGSISEQAVLEAIASLNLDVEGFSAKFSELAGYPGVRVYGSKPVVAGQAGEALLAAPLDGTVPLDTSAIALLHPSEVTNALDLLPQPASVELHQSLFLLDFDGETIFDELTPFTSMALPAPLLLLLSAIGWLALGARGRAER